MSRLLWSSGIECKIEDVLKIYDYPFSILTTC